MLRFIKKEYPNYSIHNQVAMAELFINNTPRTTISFAPLELMTLQEVNLTNDKVYLSDSIRQHVQEQLFKQKTRQQEKKNEFLREVNFKVGDKVWFYPRLPTKRLRQLAYLATTARVIRHKKYELDVASGT